MSYIDTNKIENHSQMPPLYANQSPSMAEQNQAEVQVEEENKATSNYISPFELFRQKNEQLQAKKNDASIDANPPISDLLVEYMHNAQKWPAVHYAIEQDRPDIAKILLELYPEQAHQLTPETTVWGNYFSDSQDYDYIAAYDPGFSALELSIKKGFTDLTRDLIQRGVDVNASRLARDTHWAEINYTGQTGKFQNIPRVERFYTPLYWAIQNQDHTAVELLLNHGAKMEDVYVYQSLFGGPPGWHPIDKREALNALEVAAATKNERVLGQLIFYQMPKKWLREEEIPASVIEIFMNYTVNETHQPTLFEVLSKQDIEAFKILIPYADINEKHQTKSIFQMALKMKDPTYCHSLLQEGFNKNEAFLLSLEAGQMEFVNLLLNEADKKGAALRTVIKLHDIELVKLLIEHGFHDTLALQLALEEKQSEIAKLFLK